MCKIENFQFTDQIQMEFRIFEIGKLEFGTKIGFCDFKLCQFGSNLVMGFLKSEFEIPISISNSFFIYIYICVCIILYIYVI